MVRLGKFGVTHAKTLKDAALVEWLKSGKYRCMVDDLPCQLPDLSQFRAVTQQLRLPAVLPILAILKLPHSKPYRLRQWQIAKIQKR